MARPRTHFQCTRSGCDKPHVARGFCSMHYRRDLRGFRDLDAPPAPRLTPEQIKLARVLVPGRTRQEAADLIGCHPSTLDRLRKRKGIAPGHASRPPKVPDWVPPAIVEGFLAKMRKRGQFEAAAWARKQIRETRA